MTNPPTPTKSALPLPERLSVTDHGPKCGNAIRFELYDAQGYELIASVEVDNEKRAGKIAAEIERRYNAHEQLRSALKRISNGNDLGRAVEWASNALAATAQDGR